MSIQTKAKYRVWYNGKMWYPDGDEQFLIGMNGDLFIVGDDENQWENPEGFPMNISVPADAAYMRSLSCTDRNGKVIYAGDALQWPHQNYHYVVEWCPQEMAYMLFIHGRQNSPFNTLAKEISFLKPTMGLPEIIGNRYENPELVDKSWTSE